MPVVTAITEQARDPNRRSVFIDGEYAFSMSLDQLLEHGVAVGDVLTEEQVAFLAEEGEVRRAKEYVLRLLGHRAYSESEVRRRLRRKQFSEQTVERAVEAVRRLGLIDDRQFAEAWVHSRAAAGQAGRRRVEWELRSRGVDRQVIEQTLAGYPEQAEFASALEVAQRRYERLRDEEPEAVRRKLALFLQRRGFAYDDISKVLETILPPE
ncbi:MAG: regulatory protein RecX [Armatimonadetes bacterium]|nr:regulatory protein RecX [Armatimonadota bacterium]